MKPLSYAFLIGLGLLAVQRPAVAQSVEDIRPLEINVHAGTMNLDVSDDWEVMAGGRVGLTHPSGWGVAGNLDWVDSETFDTYFYSAEVQLNIRTGIPALMFLAAGVGIANFQFDDEADNMRDSTTELATPLAIGLKWNMSAPPWLAYRIDIRDNIVYPDAVDDDANHNWEISAGVSALVF